MNILLTGFEPFNNRKRNNSWEIVKLFINHSEIDCVEVPVSFTRADKVIIDKLCQKGYDLILMIGETSASSDKIRLERVALNLMDASIPDNDNVLADEIPIDITNLPSIFTNFPIKSIYSNLKREGYPVKLSNSAGTFVCNCLYFKILNYVQKKNLKNKVLFIHVPSSTDTVSLDDIQKTVTKLIGLYKQLIHKE